MQRPLSLILLALGLCSAAGLARADAGSDPAAGSWEPAPFHADYEVRYEGVPFTVSGTRSLSRDESGALHFSARIRTWLLRIDEQSTMEVLADGGLRPLDYAYRQRGIGRRRTRVLDFDWESGFLHRSGDREKTRPLSDEASEHLFDPVSWQIALRRDLARGDAEPGDVLRYPITDGGEAKVYRIAVRGREDLELPAGEFETVLLERIFEPGEDRATRIWLAPVHDWLLVRLEHTDENGRTLRLALSGVEIAEDDATHLSSR